MKASRRFPRTRPDSTRLARRRTAHRMKFENTVIVFVDPSQVYFSSRLSTQQLETVQQLHTFADTLGRPRVADLCRGWPSYDLLALEDVVAGYLVGDLNPPPSPCSRTTCDDGRTSRAVRFAGDRGFTRTHEHGRTTNASAVRPMPYSSACRTTARHLPDLFPLFDQSTTSLLRGWAIVERSSLDGCIDRLNRLVGDAGEQRVAHVGDQRFLPPDVSWCFRPCMGLKRSLRSTDRWRVPWRTSSSARAERASYRRRPSSKRRYQSLVQGLRHHHGPSALTIHPATRGVRPDLIGMFMVVLVHNKRSEAMSDQPLGSTSWTTAASGRTVNGACCATSKWTPRC